jgi:hypothetical protein
MKTRLDIAIAFAVAAHSGQTDKTGKPYILHPLEVMMHPSLVTEDEKITGVLHDTVEETKDPERVNHNVIHNLFGSEVGIAIRLLTHDPKVPYEDYIRAMVGYNLAVKGKLADLDINMGRPPLPNRVRWQRNIVRYAQAKAYLTYGDSFFAPYTYGTIIEAK